ncbi:hypothetical protein ZHAS_00020019 [Anopheles sinensis]|uniref:Uncharacterized protein n=1 Tax=Anopheles sinensis TaxID=74873 RepID=A0A084WNR9_ANOSI|nr:hypothetical protein ZHAS_00020019 [Anopheles sinensis]
MKRSAQSVDEPAAPGNIGSYGIFGGNGRPYEHEQSEAKPSEVLGDLGVTSATTVVTPASVVEIDLPASTQSTTVEALLDTNSTTARAASKPMFSTGNRLWDALIADCMRKPTFACIQKNVYSFLGEQLEVENMNFTNRVQFLKNRVDFTKYTREANEEDSEDDNEIPDARGGKLCASTSVRECLSNSTANSLELPAHGFYLGT